MRIDWRAIGLAVTLFPAGTSTAHHSPAAYDLRQQAIIELDGIVTRVRWANPHVYIDLEPVLDSGEDVVWRIEVDAPSNMQRHGWFRDSLVEGDRVTAEAFPGKDESARIAKLFMLVKEDGSRLSYIDPAFLDSTAPAGFNADSLTGVWAPNPVTPNSRVARLQEQLLRVSYGLDANVPLTEKGSEAVRSFTDDLSPTVSCIPRTAPSTTMLSSGLHSIEVHDDVVVLRENWFGTERTVYFNGDRDVELPLSLHGHGVARWEDDVLIIETSRFSEHREGLFNKLPSSRGKRLVESFELDPEGHSLIYRWEVSDPEYLTAPLAGSSRWTYRPDLEFSIVECSIDSARQFLED